MSDRVSAASGTVRAIGPPWSREDAKAIIPYRETRPYVGFTPTTPQREAGWRIDPPVSVPTPAKHSPAATAAAVPPDEPPGIRSVAQGFRVGPKCDVSVEDPIANSSMFCLPRRTAPAARTFSATAASYGGVNEDRMRLPHVVRIPRVQKMSLRPTGTPWSGPRILPFASSASHAAASARAASGRTVMYALIFGLSRSIRS